MPETEAFGNRTSQDIVGRWPKPLWGILRRKPFKGALLTFGRLSRLEFETFVRPAVIDLGVRDMCQANVGGSRCA